jgi:acyl-CoA thioester hydrolase
MAYEFKVTRLVEFSDTDMAGIMHYANFFRFMETAEHAFYRSLGFSVIGNEFDPLIGWPRVHASCDYARPLRFEDLVEIHLLVSSRRSKSISYQFRFHKMNEATAPEVARGALTIVCVQHDGAGRMKAVTIPPRISELIEPAPAELLAEPARRAALP